MTYTKTRANANTPNNYVSVLDFGAKGDGTTDDSGAIQACIDAAGSYTKIVFGNKKYLLKDHVAVTNDGVWLDLAGAELIDGRPKELQSGGSGSDYKNTRDLGLIRFDSELVLETTLSNPTSEGDTEFKVTDHGGRLIENIYEFVSDQDWYKNTKKFEIVRSTKYNSNGTLTSDRPIQFSMPTGTTVRVIKALKDCKVTGGKLTGAGIESNLSYGDSGYPNDIYKLGFGKCGISAEGVINFKIDGTHIEGFQNKQVSVLRGIDVHLNNLTLVGLDDVGSSNNINNYNSSDFPFYGVFINRCSNVIHNNISGYKLRHTTDGSSSFDVIYTSCTGVANVSSVFRAHEGLHKVVFQGCVGNSSKHYGGLWSGGDVVFDNCYFDHDNYGIVISSEMNTSDPRFTLAITNTTISTNNAACVSIGLIQNGVPIKSNYRLYMDGCTLEVRNTNNPLRPLNIAAAHSLDGFTVSNSTFIGNGIGINNAGNDGDVVVIRGNVFNHHPTRKDSEAIYYFDSGQDPVNENIRFNVQDNSYNGNKVVFNYGGKGNPNELCTVLNNIAPDSSRKNCGFYNKNHFEDLYVTAKDIRLDFEGEVFVQSKDKNSAYLRFVNQDNNNGGSLTSTVYAGGSDGHFRIKTNATNRVKVDANGNIGLGGQENPAEVLDVIGNAVISGTINGAGILIDDYNVGERLLKVDQALQSMKAAVIQIDDFDGLKGAILTALGNL